MPTQLMMNFWTPCWSPWNDYFDDAAMPWYAKYDFVEVYDYDLDKKDFKLRWRDDFNSWDTKKWYASDNWGFENNSSLFMGSQVYVEDGNLVLKMDYNDGHAREYPAHHEVVHHEKPHKETQPVHHDAKVVHHEAPAHSVHAVEAHHEVPVVHASAVVHEAPHHTATVAHHESPVLHHAAPVHHETVVHHEDIHKYDAPVVHHTAYSEETGYPHHYSEHEYESVGHEYASLSHHGSHYTAEPHHDASYYGVAAHHGYPEHETVTTHAF